MTSNNKDHTKSQKQRFIDKDKELECNESEEAFDSIVKKVAKAEEPKAESGGKGPKKGNWFVYYINHNKPHTGRSIHLKNMTYVEAEREAMEQMDHKIERDFTIKFSVI